MLYFQCVEVGKFVIPPPSLSWGKKGKHLRLLLELLYILFVSALEPMPYTKKTCIYRK